LALNVKLYTPHENQKSIHYSIDNEPYKYYILNIGRQFGKSLLATNQLLKWALNKRCQCAWVSPIYRQASKVFDEVIKAFAKTNGVIEKKDSTDLSITFCNGSTIQFFSAERYDNIRGFTFDYLVCDEFAFMDEKAWSEVLRATVLVKGKKVLLISTPKGKNHFFHMYNLEGVNKQYKSFTMTSYHNPLITPAEIDDARLTLPDHVFRQEYLAEFIDGGAGVFKDLIINNSPIATENYYAGIDLGRADDYSVVSIFNQQGQLVCSERYRQESWDAIVKKLSTVINRYNASTLVEVNSLGDAIFEQIRQQSNNIVQPFVTTSKSKQDIIERLVIATQQQKVTFTNIDWLLKEFDVFGWEYNIKTRSIKYSAPAGFHDDGVMATAIAYECLNSIKSNDIMFADDY
jgi:hypothetical protein